jgi:serine/threonine protein kinase
MLEVAEGVQYIHSEGVVHGDLKGVRIFILQIVNQFISFARTTSSLILISTAELLILV